MNVMNAALCQPILSFGSKYFFNGVNPIYRQQSTFRFNPRKLGSREIEFVPEHLKNKTNFVPQVDGLFKSNVGDLCQ